MAQTPIKHFVRLGNLLLVEDYAGIRTPIAMAADEDQADWLGWTLERAHGRSVRSWDEATTPEWTLPEIPTGLHLTGAETGTHYIPCGNCWTPEGSDRVYSRGELLDKEGRLFPRDTEAPKVDHSPGCFGGRGEVSKTCPACLAERFPNTDDRAKLKRAKESDALLKAVVETGDDATVLGAGQVPMAGRDFDIDGAPWSEADPFTSEALVCKQTCDHPKCTETGVCGSLEAEESDDDRPVAGDRPK